MRRNIYLTADYDWCVLFSMIQNSWEISNRSLGNYSSVIKKKPGYLVGPTAENDLQYVSIDGDVKHKENIQNTSPTSGISIIKIYIALSQN